MATGADVVFNTIVPPGLTPFLAQLHEAGFTARGGHLVCTYFDENFLNLVPAEHVEGLYGCLDYYRDVHDPFSIDLLNRYEARYPGSAMFTAGSALHGYLPGPEAVGVGGQRGRVAATRHDVIAALDHARIPQGPGGPAEMVPGPAPRADEHVHRPVRRAARSRWCRTSATSTRTSRRSRSAERDTDRNLVRRHPRMGAGEPARPDDVAAGRDDDRRRGDEVPTGTDDVDDVRPRRLLVDARGRPHCGRPMLPARHSCEEVAVREIKAQL